MDGRGWAGIGMLENQAEWLRTVFSRTSTLSFNVLGSRAPGPGKGALAHERPPSWTRLNCGSLCPGSCARETTKSPLGTVKTHINAITRSYPETAPLSSFLSFQKPGSELQAQTTQEAVGPDPITTGRDGRGPRQDPTANQPSTASRITAMATNERFSLAAPPGRRALTWLPLRTMSYFGTLSSQPPPLEMRVLGLGSRPTEWNCWNAAPLCRRTGWDGGRARLEAWAEILLITSSHHSSQLCPQIPSLVLFRWQLPLPPTHPLLLANCMITGFLFPLLENGTVLRASLPPLSSYPLQKAFLDPFPSLVSSGILWVPFKTCVLS